jgi:hypothetical protein
MEMEKDEEKMEEKPYQKELVLAWKIKNHA